VKKFTKKRFLAKSCKKNENPKIFHKKNSQNSPASTGPSSVLSRTGNEAPLFLQIRVERDLKWYFFCFPIRIKTGKNTGIKNNRKNITFQA
jgi:hypothetical protein